MFTSMLPAATAVAVIASRSQHCAAEHYFAVADSKQTHLLMMRHVSKACEQSHSAAANSGRALIDSTMLDSTMLES